MTPIPERLAYISPDRFQQRNPSTPPSQTQILHSLGKMLWEFAANTHPLAGICPDLHIPLSQEFSPEFIEFMANLLHGHYHTFEEARCGAERLQNIPT
jgi:hypothetical protein